MPGYAKEIDRYICPFVMASVNSKVRATCAIAVAQYLVALITLFSLSSHRFVTSYHSLSQIVHRSNFLLANKYGSSFKYCEQMITGAGVGG